MKRLFTISSLAAVSLITFVPRPARAAAFFFSTGNPDGLIGTLSRPASPGLNETETADDFVTTQTLTVITSATFIGLLPPGASLSTVASVGIELYKVFPLDSVNPPSGNVATRVNSPSDNAFLSFDTISGSITVTPTILNPNFAVANTIVNGIFAKPNQFTGGEGAIRGEEVLFSVTFNTPLNLPADRYFFRPEVQLTTGNFLWLSAPKPIVSPGTPISPDLQSWIRNTNIAPDWERIGTDVTGQGPFNAAFSLTGTAIPEPSTPLLLTTGLLGLAAWRRRQ